MVRVKCNVRASSLVSSVVLILIGGLLSVDYSPPKHDKT